MASYKGLAIFLSPAIFMAAYSACKSPSLTTPHALKSRSVLYFAPHIVSSLQWIKDHVHDLATFCFSALQDQISERTQPGIHASFCSLSFLLTPPQGLALEVTQVLSLLFLWCGGVCSHQWMVI